MRAFMKKLKAELFANDITQQMLCKELNRSQTYMSQRMTGKRPFDMEDVYQICDLLEIPYGKIYEYFPRIGETKAREGR